MTEILGQITWWRGHLGVHPFCICGWSVVRWHPFLSPLVITGSTITLSHLCHPSFPAWPPSFLLPGNAGMYATTAMLGPNLSINVALLHHFAQSFAEIFCDWIHPRYIGFNALNFTKNLVTIYFIIPLSFRGMQISPHKKNSERNKRNILSDSIDSCPLNSWSLSNHKTITGLHLHPSTLQAWLSQVTSKIGCQKVLRQRFSSHTLRHPNRFRKSAVSFNASSRIKLEGL